MSQCRKNLARGKVIDGASQEESTCSAGDSLIPESGRSSGEEWLPTPVFLPREFHGQRSLAGSSGGPWGHKESDTTE